jgi:hypothetical protein
MLYSVGTWEPSSTSLAGSRVPTIQHMLLKMLHSVRRLMLRRVIGIKRARSRSHGHQHSPVLLWPCRVYRRHSRWVDADTIALAPEDGMLGLDGHGLAEHAEQAFILGEQRAHRSHPRSTHHLYYWTTPCIIEECMAAKETYEPTRGPKKAKKRPAAPLGPGDGRGACL